MYTNITYKTVVISKSNLTFNVNDFKALEAQLIQFLHFPELLWKGIGNHSDKTGITTWC